LESVKNQTYEKIELVVSDDCSTDNTVEIVREWIEVNKARFAYVQLLTTAVNTGIAANCNRLRKVYHGMWRKDLAGDDVLDSKCIELNMKYASEHPDAQVILSDSRVFYDDSDEKYIQKPGIPVGGFFDQTAQEQFESLIKYEVYLNPNTLFMRTSIINKYPVEERFKYMDDRPFYWSLVSDGIQLHYLPEITVNYRKHAGALTGGKASKTLMSLNYFDSWTDFYYLKWKPELEKRGLEKESKERQILWYLLAKYVFHNKKNLLTRAIHFLFEGGFKGRKQRAESHFNESK
jgi:alpha-1,3-rhamnosyltransferase